MLECKLTNESEEQAFDSFSCRTNIANKTICPIVRRGGLYVGDQIKSRTLNNYYSPILLTTLHVYLLEEIEHMSVSPFVCIVFEKNVLICVPNNMDC